MVSPTSSQRLLPALTPPSPRPGAPQHHSPFPPFPRSNAAETTPMAVVHLHKSPYSRPISPPTRADTAPSPAPRRHAEAAKPRLLICMAFARGDTGSSGAGMGRSGAALRLALEGNIGTGRRGGAGRGGGGARDTRVTAALCPQPWANRRSCGCWAAPSLPGSGRQSRWRAGGRWRRARRR